MYWRTLGGLRLLALLDSITSPYAETAEGGRGSPANLISEITNLGVLHHLELISVACEGHSALLARCEGASISRRRRRFRSLQDGRRRKTGEDVKQSGRDSNGAPTGSPIHHRRGGGERRPRWRRSVMIDGRWRASEASRLATIYRCNWCAATRENSVFAD